LAFSVPIQRWQLRKPFGDVLQIVPVVELVFGDVRKIECRD
jgi:hypothetical protein